ncbi:MAG: hypothetical protein WD768_13375 [Phycisphaeraceae bacterium]
MSRTGFISTALLATYLVAWLSIGPLLSLCQCDQGHTALAAKVHSQPACGGHHDHQHAQTNAPSPVTHDEPCNDTPVVSGELLVQKSTDFSIALLPQVTLLPALLQPQPLAASHFPAFDLSLDHGPPRDQCCSLRATILLI